MRSRSLRSSSQLVHFSAVLISAVALSLATSVTRAQSKPVTHPPSAKAALTTNHRLTHRWHRHDKNAGRHAMHQFSGQSLQGLVCKQGFTLQDAQRAFNNQFVGVHANQVTIHGVLDDGEMKVRHLSDLVVTTIEGKVVICAIASAL